MRPNLVVVLAALTVVGCKREEAKPVPPAPAPPAIEIIPSNTDEPEDDALVMPARRVGNRYELTLGEGRAILTLGGTASIVAPDPKTGAAFLEGAAKWLKQPLPPKTHSQPLEPVEFEVMRMGSGGRWVDHKAFFEHGAQYAELYINVASDGQQVTFLPKDDSYAPALLDIFADALRDGPAPARTKENDPNLLTEAPLYKPGTVLKKARLGPRTVCLAEGWLTLTPAGDGATVDLWRWGATEGKRLCTLPGPADQIADALHASVVAALVTARKARSNTVSSDDHVDLWTLDPTGCRPVKLSEALDLGPFDQLLVSPDGTSATFAGKEELRFVALKTGAVSHVRTGKDHLLFPYAWDDDGPLFSGGGPGVFFRVPPNAKAEDARAPSVRSRDGVYRASPVKGQLEVRKGSEAVHRYVPKVRSDLRAVEAMIEEPPRHAGAHALLLRGNPDLVLDLESLKTRPVAPPGFVPVCTSPDGEHALLGNDDGAVEGVATR